MARQSVNLLFLSASGVTPTMVAFSADGVVVPNNGAVIVELDNQTTVPKDVTIIHPGTVDGNEVADKVVTVPASDRLVLAGLSLNYNQPNTNFFWMDTASATGLSIGAYYS